MNYYNTNPNIRVCFSSHALWLPLSQKLKVMPLGGAKNMKIDPIVKKIVKEILLVFTAAFLKAWYLKQVDKFFDFVCDKIDEEYEEEVTKI